MSMRYFQRCDRCRKSCVVSEGRLLIWEKEGWATGVPPCGECGSTTRLLLQDDVKPERATEVEPWPPREDLEGYRPSDEVMLPEWRWWHHPLVTVAIVAGLLFLALFLVLRMG